MSGSITSKPFSAKYWKSATWVGNVVLLVELMCLTLSILAFGYFFTNTALSNDYAIFLWLNPLVKIWSCAGMAKVGQTVGLTGIAFAWLISSASQEIAGVSMRELVKWAYPEAYFCYFCTYFPMLIMLIYTGIAEDPPNQPFSAVCASFFTSIGALVLLAYTLRICYVLLLSHEKRRHIVLGFYISKAAGDSRLRLIECGARYWQSIRNNIRIGCSFVSREPIREKEHSSATRRRQAYRDEKKRRLDAESIVKQQLARHQQMLWRRKGIQVASAIEARYYPLYAEELAMLWHQNCVDLEKKIEALFVGLLQEQDCETTGDLMNAVGNLAAAWVTLLRIQGNRADQTVTVRYILSARLWDETENIFLCVALVDAIFQCIDEGLMSSQEALALFRGLQPENVSGNPAITERQSQYLLCSFDMYLTAIQVLAFDSDVKRRADDTKDERNLAMVRTLEDWRKARKEYKYLKDIPRTPIDTVGHSFVLKIVKDSTTQKFATNALGDLAKELEENRIRLAREMNRATITDADLAQIGFELKVLLPDIFCSNTLKGDRAASNIKETEVAEFILTYISKTKDGFSCLAKSVINSKEAKEKEPEMVMLCTEMTFRQRHHVPYVNWQRAVNEKLLNDRCAVSTIAQFLPRLWHWELCSQV